MSKEFDLMVGIFNKHNEDLSLQYGAEELIKAAEEALGTLNAIKIDYDKDTRPGKWVYESADKLKAAITRCRTKDIIQERLHG